MECFTHRAAPAVGMCRACLRGVCRECAIELRLGLACRGRCEDDVRALAATLEQSMRTSQLSSGMLQQTPRLWLGLGLVSLAIGVFVVLFGMSLPSYREIAALGVPFLAIGGLMLAVVRKLGAARS